MILIHRAYHPQTNSFVYWDSGNWDPSGGDYDQSEPFNELETITVVLRLEDDSTIEDIDWGLETNRNMTA